MKTYTIQEVLDLMHKWSSEGLSIEYDNDGQIVLYTGIFRWNDGSDHDEPDPNLDDPIEVDAETLEQFRKLTPPVENKD